MSNQAENKQENCKQSSIIDEDKIAAEAKKYMRIGGKWYKKAIDPITKQQELYPVQASMLISDEGKEIGSKILKMAPKYLATTNLPSHTNYRESVGNADGERFYNLYRPIKYSPSESGSWPHIEELIRHIFGKQYEMGLDYVQLLYLHPLRRLPVLLLVSQENGTGKSTFCNFLNEIFGENVAAMTNETLRSKFTAPWVNKLLIFVEETLMDKKEDGEKIKNIATALTLPSEAKGQDWQQRITFVKVILCSNNELNPVVITPEDTRHWVRRVPPLSKSSHKASFLDECKKEIPSFLHYLNKRQLSTSGSDRLWFRPEETRTAAWYKIVRGSEPKLESELREVLLDIMDQTGEDTLMYDAVTLADLCNVLGVSKGLRGNIGRTDIKVVLGKWGLTASKITERFRYWWQYGVGGTIEQKEKVGRVYKISRKILGQNTHQDEE